MRVKGSVVSLACPTRLQGECSVDNKTKPKGPIHFNCCNPRDILFFSRNCQYLIVRRKSPEQSASFAWVTRTLFRSSPIAIWATISKTFSETAYHAH